MEIEKTIENIWELSKNSFVNEKSELELRKLSIFLRWDLRKMIVIEIPQTSNQSNDMNDYYSYYKVFNEKGEYKFALPFGRFQSLSLKTNVIEPLDSIITKESEDDSKSRNGGCYSEGYRVEKLIHPTLELYRVKFSWALFSDFEGQCSEKPELLTSVQELVELDNSNLLQSIQ